MKRLLLFLLVLAALTTSAALADFTSLTAPSASIATVDKDATDGWRRTAIGWEHERAWQHTDPFAASPITHLHPAIIATLQLLATLGALVWFEK
jgi:hypothetical protein